MLHPNGHPTPVVVNPRIAMKRLSFRLTSRRTVLLTALLLAASGAQAARDIDNPSSAPNHASD
jgi:hypothetical protein